MAWCLMETMEPTHVNLDDIPLIAPSWTTFTSLNTSLGGHTFNRFPITTLPHFGGTGYLIIPRNNDEPETITSDLIDDEDNYEVFTAKKYFKDSKLLFQPKR